MWLSPVFSVSQSISRLFVCDLSSQQKPHGWMEDNRGHLLSVWTCWCSATETVLPGVPEGPHAARCTACTRGDRLAESPLWAPGSTGACLHCARAQELQRTVCVFEMGLVEAGSLHNRAINLNWSSLVEHRKTFSALRRRCVSPELHKIETDLRLS